jgi:hypothetical protein
MSVPYLPVPDLIQRIEDRDTFPEAITDDELRQTINAANRLIGRARQELANRFAARLRAGEMAPSEPKTHHRMAEGHGHD